MVYCQMLQGRLFMQLFPLSYLRCFLQPDPVVLFFRCDE